MNTSNKIMVLVALLVVFGLGFYARQPAPAKLQGALYSPVFQDYADSTSATTTLAAWPGTLHTVTIATPVANSVINVFDAATTSTATTSRLVATITLPVATSTPFTLTFDNAMVYGLTVSQSVGTSTITAEYQQN